MIVVNGAPPSDYLRSEPYDAAAYSTALHVYEPYTDRETVAFGFNDTRRPRCQQELDDDVYIALRCVHPVGPDPGPCGYNLTATLVPLTLRHGDEFDAYLAPATTTTDPARHYYHIAVSAFEQLAVSIQRKGDANQPFDEVTGESLGLGLAGAAYMERLGGSCPSNASAGLEPSCSSVRSASTTVRRACCHACSADGDDGAGGESSPSDLVLMIEAEIGGSRPPTYIDQATSPYKDFCEPEPAGVNCQFVLNYVDYEGRRPTGHASTRTSPRGSTSRSSTSRRCRRTGTSPPSRVTSCDPTAASTGQGDAAAVRRGRPRPGETRPLPLVRPAPAVHDLDDARSTRRERARRLTRRLGAAAVYVAEGGRREEAKYDVMVERGGSAGDKVLRLSASPCALREAVTWSRSLSSHSRSPSPVASRPPSMRSAYTRERACYRRAAPCASGEDVTTPAKGAFGDGFVCCGVVKYFLVPGVPGHLSVAASLRVTKGVARAMYLKAQTCPRFAADVLDETCVGQCEVRWLTRFNPYDGSPLSTDAASITIPNGLGDGCPANCPPDRRQAGDWYVGVQALDGSEAEFELNTTLIEPPPIDRGYQCDPSAPECRAPLDFAALQSAAPHGGRRRTAGPAAGGAKGRLAPVLLALAAGVAVLVMHGMLRLPEL